MSMLSRRLLKYGIVGSLAGAGSYELYKNDGADSWSVVRFGRAAQAVSAFSLFTS